MTVLLLALAVFGLAVAVARLERRQDGLEYFYEAHLVDHEVTV